VSFRLLLLEDDLGLGALIEGELVKAAYETLWVKTLAEARATYAEKGCDLAIVDILLPDGKGFEFVRESSCPIIMMSALNDPENRLEGIELGALDFIPKPFLIKELLIKIKRVLQQKAEVISLGGVELDMVKRQVRSPEGSLFLNRRDFKILEVLMAQAPRVVSRDGIIDAVYGPDQNPSHRSIDNAIVGLRQLLQDKDHEIIRSVRGEGYQWGREKK